MEKASEIEKRLLHYMCMEYGAISIEKTFITHIGVICKDLGLYKYYSPVYSPHKDYDFKDVQAHIEQSEEKQFWIEVKASMYLMTIMESLCAQGFIERKICIFSESFAEDGYYYFNDSDLVDTQASNIRAISEFLLKTKNRVVHYHHPCDLPQSEGFTIDRVTYELTSKGYDVALKLIEHEDNETRFKQQHKFNLFLVIATIVVAATGFIELVHQVFPSFIKSIFTALSFIGVILIFPLYL